MQLVVFILRRRILNGCFVAQVEIVKKCCILAAVGQRMASTPGVSATLFTALAKVRMVTIKGNIMCSLIKSWWVLESHAAVRVFSLKQANVVCLGPTI